MNSNQIKGDSRTHSIFVRALLKELRFEEAVDFMKTEMGKTSLCRQTRIWDSLIQGICIKGNDPEKALSVLRDCLRIDGILPSSFTFCSLIRSFCSLGKMDGAIEVLELMSDEKIKYPFDNFVCSSVISGFVKIGKPELAVGFYENAAKSDALQPNVVTYTALMSAYCRLGKVEKVFDLVSRMEKDGLAFDAVFYSSWIYEYFREGILEEALQKHREMVERKLELDAIGYSILIDGFSKEGHVEKAVGFLHKMKKDGLKPNLIIYTAIVSGFCKKGKLDEAFATLEMVEDLGFGVDEFAYATLIDGVCRWDDFDLVFHLLDGMEKKGIKPSVITYNTVINGLCKAGRTSEADEISKGMDGDTVTYSTLLHGYFEEENTMGMLGIKRRLEESGVSMDIIMCNILIKALFMIGSFEDALAIYKGIPEMDLVANSVTYCTMIDGYCKAGRIDEALEIFDVFRRTSLSSVSCYNCIIRGLCRKGLVDMAVEVFTELNERGLPLDVGMHKMLLKTVAEENGAKGILNLIQRVQSSKAEIFHIVGNDAVRFLCKRGFPEAALDVYMVMRSKGLAIASRSYYAILEALIYDGKDWLTLPVLSMFVKMFGLLEPRVSKILLDYLCMKDVNDALKYFEMIKKNNGSASFSVCILGKLTRIGRVLDAYKLLMATKDIRPLVDVVDYSIIVDGLCKGGHIEKALDLCAFARNNGIILNIFTYNSVINGLCRQGCLVEAFRLFDSLEKIDIIPSEITYSTLIDTLTKEGYLPDARKLYEKMVLKGLKPNTRVFDSLINEYCKSGEMLEALKLLHDLEVKGLKPDEFTVSAMINGYCHKGDMEGALGFYFEFTQKGMVPDFLGFLYLVRGLCAKGRMEESRSILREMLQVESVLNLLHKVDNEVETESVESALVFLCEQGSIQEALSVLNKVGSMFFPVGRRSGAYHESEKEEKLNGRKTCRTDELKCSISTNETDLKFESCHVKTSENVVKTYGSLDGRSLLHDFNSYYAVIASHCSRGKLVEASNVAKMLIR